MYDPDDYTNDETPPFGDDEGADVYSEWSERTDELENLSLRQMLDLDGDLSVSKSGPSDYDEVVIAAGFVHLRATGWLDLEGASWLRAALRRCDRNSPNGAFATMLRDLTSYSNRPPRARKPQTGPGWIRIRTGGGDRPLTRWCRENELALDTDPAWRTWWTTTPYATLDFYPHLDDLQDAVSVESRGDVLVVSASTRPLGRITRKHLGGTVREDTPPLPSLMTRPDFKNLLNDLLLSALQATARRLQLQAPPQHLPT